LHIRASAYRPEHYAIRLLLLLLPLLLMLMLLLLLLAGLLGGEA
jgi:hypothetical protein